MPLSTQAIQNVVPTHRGIVTSGHAYQPSIYFPYFKWFVRNTSVLCCSSSQTSTRNFAQSKTDMHKSMVLESKLTSLFLNRNFFLDPDAATTDWHFANVCSKTVRYSSQGRRSFAYANVDFFGASGTPKCFSFPSQLANSPQISRNECARPSWQNSMATN